MKGFCPHIRFREGEADLEPHLDAGQIDALLMPAWGLKAEPLSDREIPEDAHAHLNTCESCQQRVLERKKAMERLALLKPNVPVSQGAHCPPGDVWIEVAAGIANPDSERYLRHAVECDHCGQLLNQAAEDFLEELTPLEETQIANLSSSTAGWQTSLAIKLSGTQQITPNGPHAKGSWFSSVVASLTPSRLAFAAVLIGIVVLGIRDYSLTTQMSSQSLQATAGAHQLEQDVLQQKAQIADLNAQLSRPVLSAEHASPQPAEQSSIASLVLDAGLTRSTGEMKRLSVPVGTDVARITLHVPESPDGVMREELLNFDRQKIWSQELRPSDAERTSKSLTLLVPAYLLTPDDYLIKLSREMPDRPEEVATYSFRVPR